MKIECHQQKAKSEENVDKQVYPPKQKKTRKNKVERDIKYKMHLKQLYKARGGRFFSPVKYIDCIWRNGKIYYKKIPYYIRSTPGHGGPERRYWKKVSNRSIRRYKLGISKGGNYRKIFDYQWMLD